MTIILNNEFIRLSNTYSLDNLGYDLIIGRNDIRRHHEIKLLLDKSLTPREEENDESKRKCVIEELYRLDETYNLEEEYQEMEFRNEGEGLELSTLIFGNNELVEEITSLITEFGDIFSRKLRDTPAKVEPMEMDVSKEWEVNQNRLPPRAQGPTRLLEVVKQVDDMLEHGVYEIKEIQYYVKSR